MKSKKIWVSILLVTVMALLSACGSAGKLTEYELGADKVPSINAVIGETRKVTGVSTGTDNGVQYKQYTYQSALVEDDLAIYTNYLRENGWLVTKDYDLTTGKGEAQLAKESVDDGNILIISIAFDSGEYAIRFNKLEGELTPN